MNITTLSVNVHVTESPKRMGTVQKNKMCSLNTFIYDKHDGDVLH